MLDAATSGELRAAVQAMRQARRDIRTDMNRDARGRIRPLWQGELAARSRRTIDRAVILAGTRATPTARGFRLTAAASTRPLRGGLTPAWDWPAVEFGATPKPIIVRQRSRSGRMYQRRMVKNRQFRGRSRDGVIAFDAASEVGTRLVQMWVKFVVDRLGDVPGAEVTS